MALVSTLRNYFAQSSWHRAAKDDMTDTPDTRAAQQPAASRDDEVEPPATRRQWLVLIVVLSATFVQLLDVSIVNVAAPDIQATLAAPYSAVALVLVGYQLGFACTLITAARLGDIVGRRRMFLIGMTAFTAASIACGLAGSIEVLITARVLQGIASGLMFPQVLSIIQVIFRPQDRGAAFGAYGTTIGLGTILGPVAGGALIQAGLFTDAWRAIFYVNVPIGIAALVAGALLLPESTAPDRPRLDLLGALMSAVGLGLVLYPLAQGRSEGWPVWLLSMFPAGIAVLLLFVAHQRARTRAGRFPVLDTTLFTRRAFTVGALISVVFYAGVASFFFAFNLYLQDGQGFSALAAGLTTLPYALGAAVTASTADGITARIGVRVLSVGSGLLILGMSALIVTIALVGTRPSGFWFVPALLLGGLGFGLFVPPLIDIVLAGVPRARAGAASGALSSLQQVGAALGVTILGIIFFGVLGSLTPAGGQPDAQTYTDTATRALIYEVVIYAVVLALVAALPKTDPARIAAQTAQAETEPGRGRNRHVDD
jgi:EmrB/QacA subfamily drug resistance transporter